MRAQIPLHANPLYMSGMDYTPFTITLACVSFLAATGSMAWEIIRRRGRGTSLRAEDANSMISYFSLVAVVIGVLILSGMNQFNTLIQTNQQFLTVMSFMGLINFAFVLSVGFSNYSILYMYREIFCKQIRWFRYTWYFMLFLLPFWMAFTLVGFSFMMHLGRVTPETGTGLTEAPAVGFIGAVTTMLIVTMPLAAMQWRRIKLNWTQRIEAFGMGFLALLTIALFWVRGARSFQSSQQSWDQRYQTFEDAMLDLAQATVLFMYASPPVLKSILEQFGPGSAVAGSQPVAARKEEDQQRLV